MRQVIIDSGKQLSTGLDLAKDAGTKGSFDNIIVCALGGSALPADILLALNNITIPVIIHRDYNLPPTAGKKSLVICISYSGNTEETVSALNEAVGKNLAVVGIASGGMVEEICKENNFPFVKIPGGIQPRSATGYIFSALAKILENSGIIENISDEILAAQTELGKIMADAEKDGEIIAKKLPQKLPVIYSSSGLEVLAKIWKIKFNENSKVPAFYNYFPELNHNEMVGYSGLANLGYKNFHVIILQDPLANPKILKRMELTSEIIMEHGGEVEIVKIKEGSLLFKIFSTLLLGDWVSYYLALQYGIDPTPVAVVEAFKKSMNS